MEQLTSPKRLDAALAAQAAMEKRLTDNRERLVLTLEASCARERLCAYNAFRRKWGGCWDTILDCWVPYES